MCSYSHRNRITTNRIFILSSPHLFSSLVDSSSVSTCTWIKTAIWRPSPCFSVLQKLGGGKGGNGCWKGKKLEINVASLHYLEVMYVCWQHWGGMLWLLGKTLWIEANFTTAYQILSWLTESQSVTLWCHWCIHITTRWHRHITLFMVSGKFSPFSSHGSKGPINPHFIILSHIVKENILCAKISKQELKEVLMDTDIWIYKIYQHFRNLLAVAHHIPLLNIITL